MLVIEGIFLVGSVLAAVHHAEVVATKWASPTDDHADPPTTKAMLISLGALLAALVAVVGLTKIESPAIEAGVAALGFPPSFVGVVIALLVLLPESIAAVKAASRNRLQTSLKLVIPCRAKTLQGWVHLVLLAAFLFLSVRP